jgi:nucleoside-diphosphate-sugar epimerase
MIRENVLAADLDYILERTEQVWGELKDGQLFMTGGTGFIGTWLLEAFAWANQKLKLNLSVAVLTRNPEAFEKKVPHLAHNPLISFERGDVRSFEFPHKNFSHIIHAATEASATLNKENPQLMLDTIVQGTRRVLEFAEHTHAKKMLYLSSGAVYGKQPPEVGYVAENFKGSPDILNPNSAYGIGKCIAEHHCVLHSQKHLVEIKIARCFAFVGPYLPLNKHFAIGNFIRDGLLEKNILVNGDGTPFRSYQYAADLVIWLLQIMCRGEPCAPYNVGSDEALSIADVAKVVAKSFPKVPYIKISKKPTAQLPDRYVPSVQRAKKNLGLSAGIDLSQAIRKTIDFYKYARSQNKENVK